MESGTHSGGAIERYPSRSKAAVVLTNSSNDSEPELRTSWKAMVAWSLRRVEDK